MKKCLLILFGTLLSVVGLQAQVYLDQFENGMVEHMGGSGSYAFSEMDGELTVSATATGAFDVFTYQPHMEGAATMLVDATANNKVFVRAKASNIGTQLRLDLQDDQGYVTSLAGITKTLTTEFMELEFDFTNMYNDGGFGGPCQGVGNPGNPCPVDGSSIDQLIFFTNPGAGGFNGTVVIDYISFGEKPAEVVMSDIFQDHFDLDSSFNAVMYAETAGYSHAVNNSLMTFTGTGVAPSPYEPFNYRIRNPQTNEEIDVDMTGNNKIYLKMRSSQEGTVVRMDVEDIDNFITTLTTVQKIVGTEWAIYEFDYSGVYLDAGWGGTACMDDDPPPPATNPCPVDGERIAGLVFFLNPGQEDNLFNGTLEIEYLSFGVSLDPIVQGDLLFSDHFNNEQTDFINDPAGFISSETGTEWTIAGDGNGTPYSAMAYGLHDVDGNTANFDMNAAKHKVFVKAKTEDGTAVLRLDLVDSTGFVTNQSAQQKEITSDWTILEYDFTSLYFDLFSQTCADSGNMPPCDVNSTVINTMLFYIDPDQGGYTGNVIIDYISIGQPIGDDNGPTGLPFYVDQMDDNTGLFLNSPAGLESSFADDEWTITGDGTGGAWDNIAYMGHNEDGTVTLINSGASDDKLYIRVKSSLDTTELRIDLQDNEGYMTNANGLIQPLTSEYQVLVYDFAGNYNDGGFGGPCSADDAPCPVDPERIESVIFFVDPGEGAFAGEIMIDWISFGKDLSITTPPAGLVNYNDEMAAATDFTEGAGGLAISFPDDVLTISGDGSAGAFSAVTYTPHNDTEEILASCVGSNDLLFIKAKSSVDGTEFRVDFQDWEGYNTNNNPALTNLTTEYQVIEFNYADRYADGGFTEPCQSAGGSTANPCPMDGERVSTLLFFLDAAAGGFNGTVEIDWLSFGVDLSTAVADIPELEKMAIYPNPTTGDFVVDYQLGKASEVSFQVYNALGKKLINTGINRVGAGGQNTSLSLADYPAGNYYLQVMVNGNTSQGMMIVKQ